MLRSTLFSVAASVILLNPGALAGFTWALRGIQPPGALRLTRDDSLRVTYRSRNGGGTLRLRGRMLTPAGDIVPFGQDETIGGGYIAQDFDVVPGDGFLLGLGLQLATAGFDDAGDLYASIVVRRGSEAQAFEAEFLSYGYVIRRQGLHWPPGMYQAAGEGPGSTITVVGAAPAVGADWTQDVPAGARWRLVGVHATLTTSATVASRRPRIVIDQDGQEWGFFPSSADQLASTTRVHHAAALGANPGQLSAIDFILLPPDLDLTTGATPLTIEVKTLNLQAGDSWNAPKFVVRAWAMGF